MNPNNKNLIKIIDINTLVISGGGMKGFLFLGAVKLLFELDIIKKIKYFYGTSVGGFVILCLNLGWNLEETLKFTINFPIDSIIEFDIDTFIENFGLVPKINFETIIKKIITYKGFNENITFSELYSQTSKEINFITYSLKNNDSLVINHINTPDLMVWEGLYMTASLPILIPPYIHNNDMFIDGGIIDNFPIDRVRLENRSKIFGICAHPYTPKWSNLQDNISNKEFINYSLELIKIFFTRPKKHLTNNYIKLNNSDMNDMFDFKMNSEMKEKLINIGYQQSLQQIDSIIENIFREQIKSDNNIKNKFSIYNEI